MPKNDTIFKRLELATDLERMGICKTLGIDTKYKDDYEKISSVFRSVSGHTAANTFRDAHALEYKTILIDTFDGLYINTAKDLKDDYFKEKNTPKYKEKATIQQLENNIDCLASIIYENLRRKYPDNVQDKFVEEIKSAGQFSSGANAVLGSGGMIALAAKFISLPVAITSTVVGVFTAPTYRKTYAVVLRLIEIQKRINIEQKLKDLK